MSIARKIGNLGTALDSAALSTFLSKGTTDGEFDTIAWGDVTGKPSYIDSSLATQLFDSAYIQLRQSAVSSGGLDSAAVTTLIDSNYVAARATAATSSGFVMYNYNATSGQTAFQDSDTAGNVLSYTADGILVYYNGLLLADEDYTATDGSAVTLTEGADSGAQITIGKWNLTGSGSSGSSAVWYGDRGVWMGGDFSGQKNIIDYIDITSAGNATDFGDLSEAKRKASTFSNGTRGVAAGGHLSTNESTNVMEYITFSTTGNATDFGDLSTALHHGSGSSDGTTGLISGGKLGSSGSYAKQNIIQSVTIDTASNASDFGDLTFANSGQGGCNDATYSVAMGGEVSPYNNIEYVTIATPGNATDFGDLITGRMYGQGLSDTTRGLYAGGFDVSVYTNTIEYITIATTGNATDFGDLVGTATSMASNGCSNATTGVFGSFYRTVNSNIMESVTIQTTGNASDFGDLTVSRSFASGTSGAAS